MRVPVTRTCSLLRPLGTKRDTTRVQENADKPQTRKRSSRRCRLFEVLENGGVWFFGVRESGLCHYDPRSRPSGWRSESLTGVTFKLTPRQRSFPGGGSVAQELGFSCFNGHFSLVSSTTFFIILCVGAAVTSSSVGILAGGALLWWLLG